MSLRKVNFLVLMAAAVALLIPACNQFNSPASQHAAAKADTGRTEKPEKSDKNDKNDLDLDLPPTGGTPGKSSGPASDPIPDSTRPGTGEVKLFELPKKIESKAPDISITEKKGREHPDPDTSTTVKTPVFQPEPAEKIEPLPRPKAGQSEPSLDPKLLAVTYVGGTGDQWIQKVGFTADDKIFGRSGGGAFTVYYAIEGTKFLEIVGDPNLSSGGPRGANFNTKGPGAFKGTDPATKIALEIGSHEETRVLVQPYLTSSLKWKWWGWNGNESKGMADVARGVRVWSMHEGRFLAKAYCEGAKTTLLKDPRNLKEDNAALSTAYLKNPAGPGTLYMVGLIKNGEPLVGTFVQGKAMTEAIDPWERVYVGVPVVGKTAPDAFKLGGDGGFSVLDANLTSCLFSTTLGADHIYSMAIRNNLLVVGGSIGRRETKTSIDPAKLKVLNPAQDKPGGGEDGFLAIIRLW